MSAVASPIERLRELGGNVFLDGGRLKYRIPDTPEANQMIEEIRANRAAVLEMLREQESTAPSLEEVLAALALPPVAPAECKHCGAKGECDCPACNLRRVSGPVPCLMCRPRERQVWLAATRPESCFHCGGSGKCKCISCGEACGVCGGRNLRTQ